MTTILGEEPGAGKLFEGISNGQRCQSVDALAEWRSSEQVESSSPSTSPPYWETDEEEGGAKPCELFGKHTWKIEKFSQINKRELRSSVFEVGGYKWYILIYPQGCDVCNHLSLFLCVANHDKLLPGWSHFAQFTIAVVNKDPKKSKYSDTLHRFWKKEHDWGWKKFMELSKIPDGFIDADTLIINAQVQVIREKAERPFRCLDCQYRRELVRVYLTNVEQICRRFVEERRGKLGKLIEDKARWSSFCSFWLGMDQNTRHCMSKERTDVILKVVVKHFFIEKEVTSTLVMDSLYSGFKALESQFKSRNAVIKMLDSEEILSPIVSIDKDMFVLVDDVLLLLERAAIEPLPPKDDKGPQNRTKEGNSGENMSKDSIERDEKRLTELGRRTVEIFVLAHIFSNKIEVAYQEAVSLKRQEELIREEEEAVLAESEKAKRCGNDKDKKSKKKQGKQKKNNRKSKDKARDERAANVSQKHDEDRPDDKPKEEERQALPDDEKQACNEDVSDASGSADCVVEAPLPDPEERDPGSANWDTDTSEVHPPDSGSNGLQNGVLERKNQTLMDDSSSTCSTDSVPSVVMNGRCNGRYSYNNKSQKSPRRGRNQQVKVLNDGWSPGCVKKHPSGITADVADLVEVSGNGKISGVEPNGVQSSQDRAVWLEKNSTKRELNLQQKKQAVPNSRDQDEVQRPSKPKPAPTTPVAPAPVPASSPGPTPPSRSPMRTTPPTLHPKTTTAPEPPVRPKKPPSERRVPTPTPSPRPSPPDNPSTTHIPTLSRPSSAPLVPALRPPNLAVSPAQTALSRSVSAAGRIGPDHSPAPQSYRNAIVGGSVSPVCPTYPRPPVFHLSSQTPEPGGGGEWVGGRKDVGPAGGSAGRHAQGTFVEEFPHLDIINDLLDDEHAVGRGDPYAYGRHPNSRYSFHPDGGIPGEVSPSSAPCLAACYGFAGFTDYGQRMAHILYGNGQADRMMSAQWQMQCPEMARGAEGEVYAAYRGVPVDYTAGGGFPIFRPASGH